MEFIIAAISLGFLGSFHCIGMCGPIALALPVNNKTTFQKTMLISTYNLGRILTYSIFGLLFGLIGQGFAIAGYQQMLSVIIGAIILIGLLVPEKHTHKYKFTSKTISIFSKIKNHLQRLFQTQSKPSFFLIGLLNGLLPCGLVYMGIAGAIATGNSLHGMLFMAVFGFGTLPIMFSLPFVGNMISLPIRNKIRKTVPVIVGMMAILLVIRGLNLGIPYISPKIDSTTNSFTLCHTGGESKSCCHKK